MNQNCSDIDFEDLTKLNVNSSQKDVKQAIAKYSSKINDFSSSLKSDKIDTETVLAYLNKTNDVVIRAWAVEKHGYKLGCALCNTVRTSGVLDIITDCLESSDLDVQFAAARLLKQCLTLENREHIVKNDLEKIVKVACLFTNQANSVEHSRISSCILGHLFKQSESICRDVITLGGLDAVLFECRNNDVETLRHCATALANLSLFGGDDNQEAMIKQKVPMWLFHLAYHTDDNIKYYACLAIVVLMANKEIEAAVVKSGTLDLVDPFVTTHHPLDFARSRPSNARGRSKSWLQQLVPVLNSKREEARDLAAFHFCMEAEIKKQQGSTEIFKEIGATELLKKVASSPNAVASKYASQALNIIGEQVPRKLSHQVPLWSVEDVREWVKQIGFSDYVDNFYGSHVDGDLLLQLTDENLREDIGLQNGIKRKRFNRELQELKQIANYSSRDKGMLHEFLRKIGPEYTVYTYSMLTAGVNKESLRDISEEQLKNECGIINSIHRFHVLNAIKVQESTIPRGEGEIEKNLDVFLSYRRSNGSLLASLLKVHLQLRGFTVFIDVNNLESGRFDNNLVQTIKQSINFLLILTPNALDRCRNDNELKDWIHQEVVTALQAQCNIVPIVENFEWPMPEELPEDMRELTKFNSVFWIHNYQDACIDKIER